MKQGEIWLTDLNPTEGSEQAGFRPVVIISGNVLNDYANVVICCPLTTKLKHYHGNLIVEPGKQNGLKKSSEVLTFQVRSLAKKRLKNKLGSLSSTDLAKIHKCLNEILKY
ncbi:MAG: type II toxin-antitoxin system PemK/MazF family toxin [Cytophaga sp.]|uniref:type II toxin-antitoxin system PemK/MazF family toxin n=1 Tax=Cytophaga sp. TaxID=29535 RepID=UPI003F80537B